MPGGQSPPRVQPAPAQQPRAAPVAWAAPAVLASNKQGAASTDLDPRGNQRRAAGPCTARVRCPARRPRPRPRQRADVGRDCAEPNPAAPHINRVFTASGTCSPCGWNTRGSQKARPRLRRRQSSSTVPHTRQAIRPAAPSLCLLGLDRMQPVARQRSSAQPVPSSAGSFTGGTRLQHSGCGCNTLCCVTHVLPCRGRCPGGRQWWRRCRRGMDSAAVQMWAGDGLFRGAEVGKGSTQSSCRCGWGVELVPVQMWAGMSPVRW
jgi:hypothetical protein